jgi:uncharacterized protein
VQRILDKTGRSIQQVIGDTGFLKKLDPAQYTDERFGLPTVKDILAELEKPGRDPRPELRTAAFKEGVETLEDLKADMVLEGVVTNVTHFGAFVDIGVHQDGLVHISALADKFVKDPHAVVKAGDVVKVKVLEVDLKRRRVALSMRLSDQGRADKTGGDQAGNSMATTKRETPSARRAARPAGKPEAQPQTQGTMAAAFAKAGKKP